MGSGSAGAAGSGRSRGLPSLFPPAAQPVQVFVPAGPGATPGTAKAKKSGKSRGRIILQKTLYHPLRHLLFLAATMAVVTIAGWALGTALRLTIPLQDPLRFFIECGLWLAIVALAASPLASEKLRNRLIVAIPR